MYPILPTLLTAFAALVSPSHADSGDTGDSGGCDGPAANATYQDGQCVYADVADCCGVDGCTSFSEYLAEIDSHERAWDCAPGSEVGHVFFGNRFHVLNMIWFDEAGNKLGSWNTGGYCCQEHDASSFTCGPPMGTCLAPVLTELPDDPAPTPPPAPPSRPCEQPQGAGCSTNGGQVDRAWLLALAILLRVRR